ncbi:MAG: hypothetical protein ACI4WX_05875 [Aristaeellaceae bacterium]
MSIDIRLLTPAGQANDQKMIEGLPVMGKFEEMTRGHEAQRRCLQSLQDDTDKEHYGIATGLSH